MLKTRQICRGNRPCLHHRCQRCKIKDLGVSRDNIELVDGLKAQNYAISGKSGFALGLPVYVFKNGVSIIPCYGAGLWGPVWGYIAIEADGTTIKGTYFDHDSETAGLGARIKDDPAFRGQFVGKKIAWSSKPQFEIIKGEPPRVRECDRRHHRRTITSQGLGKAINTWLQAY